MSSFSGCRVAPVTLFDASLFDFASRRKRRLFFCLSQSEPLSAHGSNHVHRFARGYGLGAGQKRRAAQFSGRASRVLAGRQE